MLPVAAFPSPAMTATHRLPGQKLTSVVYRASVLQHHHDIRHSLCCTSLFVSRYHCLPLFVAVVLFTFFQGTWQGSACGAAVSLAANAEQQVLLHFPCQMSHRVLSCIVDLEVLILYLYLVMSHLRLIPGERGLARKDCCASLLDYILPCLLHAASCVHVSSTVCCHSRRRC